MLRRLRLHGKAFALSAAVAVAFLAAAPANHAQTITTLTPVHTFGGDETGGSYAPLLQAADGNYYGTTNDGGSNGYGSVFKLTPSGKFTTLHSFKPSANGAGPEAALVQGKDGVLYGTTYGYFSNGFNEVNARGSIFKITTDGVFTSLYTFGDQGPVSALAQASDGNFYGTIPVGEDLNFGAVFKITPDGAFTIIHSFTDGDDGAKPTAGLVLANDGNLYGTTAGFTYMNENVALNNGTVYRVTPAGDFTTIYRFTGGSDGAFPIAGLVLGRDGRLYGVDDHFTGQQEYSTFFALTLDGVLSTVATVAAGPVTGLVQAGDGNFYGTTEYGGAGNSGTVFELTPDGAFTTLYSLVNGTDGVEPMAAMIEGSDGDLYGTTPFGATPGNGTVFRLTFESAPSTFFTGEGSVGGNVYYLSFADGNYLGYYAFLADPHYLYHFDLGYEYVFDAADGESGVYLYDFKSSDFFYTSPGFPFPYLYDFDLQTVLYYFPDPNDPGRYNMDGIRYFYDFDTGTVISR